jgi:hypothetical protein
VPTGLGDDGAAVGVTDDYRGVHLVELGPERRRVETSKLRSAVSSQRSITIPTSRSSFRFHVSHHFVVGPSMLDGTQRTHSVSVNPPWRRS